MFAVRPNAFNNAHLKTVVVARQPNVANNEKTFVPI